MSRPKHPFSNGHQKHLDAAFEAAMEEARRNAELVRDTAQSERAISAAGRRTKGKDIAMGAVRLRAGQGERHNRWIGNAHVEVTYRGPRNEGDTVRPMYRVRISVGKLRHKITVGGAANWYEEHGLPTSPAAIDAAAGGAIRFASEADEDTSKEIAETIAEATIGALREDGSYEVRRSR